MALSITAKISALAFWSAQKFLLWHPDEMPPDFYVQLMAVIPSFVPAHLEVHIAEVVFQSLNVRQNPIFLSFLIINPMEIPATGFLIGHAGVHRERADEAQLNLEKWSRWMPWLRNNSDRGNRFWG